MMKKSILSTLFYLTTLTYSANSMALSPLFKETKQEAEQGLAYAQFNLGLMYTKGEGVAQSYFDAVKWYRKAAEQGYAKAQSNLGVMYRRGQGVAQSDVEAVKWYRKAAEQGLAQAQYNLGVMYELGKGVQQSYIKAKALYKQACENGAQIACEEYKGLNLSGY